MSELSRDAASQAGRLLRVLFLRLGQVSANAIGNGLLRAMKDSMDAPVCPCRRQTLATNTNITVIIPALNEQASLPDVINRLHQIGLRKIRVVDNGSSDRTAEVARRCRVEVVSEPRRGYGQACWTGCWNLPPEAEWILFCNADGSDDIERVPELMASSSGAEFVLGVRATGTDGHYHLTAAQRFGNKLATSLIQILWRRDYADLGPLRLISRRAFERLNMQDRGFGWTVEMQVRAATCGVSDA
jgi:glycosyltransferase involved in cell wall biosynthesis